MELQASEHKNSGKTMYKEALEIVKNWTMPEWEEFIGDAKLIRKDDGEKALTRLQFACVDNIKKSDEKIY